MNKWITASEASIWLGITTKHINECARKGKIRRRDSGMTGVTDPKYLVSAEDCLQVFKGGSVNDVNHIITTKPWTAAGLRGLRV